MELNKIYQGDAFQVLQTLPDNIINCCVTSPPYYGLRDYEVEGQIGQESTPEEYIDNLVEIFREIKRVLKDDGTIWVNIADSYAGSNKGTGTKVLSLKQNGNRGANYAQHRNSKNIISKVKGCKAKDLIGIPWLLAFALRNDGWYLRQDIIWSKPNTMPESVKDRLTKSHEYIFLLSKSKKYYFDNKIIREPCSESTIIDYKRRKTLNNKGNGSNTYQKIRHDLYRSRSAYIAPDFLRNKRDVWVINTKPYKNKGEHFATFPEALIEPCILAGCPKGGIVLDPFIGSGTTGVVANKNDRNYIGIELNEVYCKIAQNRIQRTNNERSERDE